MKDAFPMEIFGSLRAEEELIQFKHTEGYFYVYFSQNKALFTSKAKFVYKIFCFMGYFSGVKINKNSFKIDRKSNKKIYTKKNMNNK